MNERILIIEDEAAIRENIAQILEFEGFEVITAQNGTEGLEKISELFPDLILCDIALGKVSGYDVIRKVQENSRTGQIPFLFLTARAEKHDIHQGIELGADDYITKPFTHSNLIACIRKNLAKRANGKNRIKTLQDSIKNSFPHELRTPLTGIIGFADLLKSSASVITQGEIVDYANSIIENAQRLNYLTDLFLSTVNLDLMEAEKDINGKAHLETYSCPLRLLQEMVNAVELKSKRNITTLLPSDTAVHFSADLLTRAFSELLDNAVKFADPGENIFISSTICEENLTIVFENAAGSLTPDDVAMIDEFVQLNRKNHEHRGIGLGLSFARKSVKFFGGEFTMGLRNSKFFIEIKLLRCEKVNECIVN